jgi:mRNA interferase MazF
MQRGEVLVLPAPKQARGHEQRGQRYAVVLQADSLLALSTVLVAPTSTRAAPATFHPVVTVAGKQTQVLVEQVRAVDPARLGRTVGRLDLHELAEVEDALRTVLDL